MSRLLFALVDGFLRWEIDAARWARSLTRAMGHKTKADMPIIRHWAARLGAWRSLWGVL